MGFISKARSGVSIKELCSRHGFTAASFRTWRAKYDAKRVSDARRVKELQTENVRLQKQLMEAMLDIEALRMVVQEHEFLAGPARDGFGEYL
jgi:putative transposase